MEVVFGVFLLLTLGASLAPTLADETLELDPASFGTTSTIFTPSKDDAHAKILVEGAITGTPHGKKNVGPWMARRREHVQHVTIPPHVTEDHGDLTHFGVPTIMTCVPVLPRDFNMNSIYVLTTSSVLNTKDIFKYGKISVCTRDTAMDGFNDSDGEGQFSVHNESMLSADKIAFNGVDILAYITLPPTVFILTVVLITFACMTRKPTIGYEVQQMAEDVV